MNYNDFDFYKFILDNKYLYNYEKNNLKTVFF